MPKEVIKDGIGGQLIVGWNPEHKHGQVAVDLGRKFKFVSETKDAQDEEFTGLYFTFHDRDSYNRVIKALRRARDGAFGKDA